MNIRCSAVMIAVLAILGGCATTPDSIIHKAPADQVSRRMEQAVVVQNGSLFQNGSIFQNGSFRPLFEDRRARHIGDSITIAINEKTSAGKQGTGSNSKTNSISYSAPQIFGLSSAVTDKFGVSASGANKFEDKGVLSSSNTFSGTIGVTVIDVMPNGNLLVSGEKQVALDRGAEFIRFSGVVNPDNIAIGNVVSSTLVSDARVEYRTNTRLDTADVMSQLTRFFLSVMPL